MIQKAIFYILGSVFILEVFMFRLQVIQVLKIWNFPNIPKP